LAALSKGKTKKRSRQLLNIEIRRKAERKNLKKYSFFLLANRKNIVTFALPNRKKLLSSL